jgi:two-component system cell cycle sensor histidine kinase/response regulator CckA
VEDDEDIRDLVVHVLEAEGFDVYQAENGEQALGVLEIMPQPALILADLMMPVMDGPSLIAALRGSAQFATLPVVIMSAVSGETAGARHRIKKPLDMSALILIVGEVCRRRR